MRVYIPFTGSREMFSCHGSTIPVLSQDIELQDGQLLLKLITYKSRLDKLSNEVQSIIRQINGGLDSLNEAITRHNPRLAGIAARHIRERQDEFRSHKNVLGTLQQTGFSLRRRDDSPARTVVPVKPKPIAVQQQRLAGKPVHDPELSILDYDAILQVIQDMVKVFERSPSVFKEMEEEHLRTILLVALNGVFQGKATGETFNGTGKTDILIRENNNNIFIAECLIWDGPAKLEKKIVDQLFKYATWADSKLAVIVFNRNKNFTGVVDSMKESVDKLPNRVLPMSYHAPNSCRHKFRRADDPQREFILTAIAFEVPA